MKIKLFSMYSFYHASAMNFVCFNYCDGYRIMYHLIHLLCLNVELFGPSEDLNIVDKKDCNNIRDREINDTVDKNIHKKDCKDIKNINMDNRDYKDINMDKKDCKDINMDNRDYKDIKDYKDINMDKKDFKDIKDYNIRIDNRDCNDINMDKKDCKDTKDRKVYKDIFTTLIWQLLDISAKSRICQKCNLRHVLDKLKLIDFLRTINHHNMTYSIACFILGIYLDPLIKTDLDEKYKNKDECVKYYKIVLNQSDSKSEIISINLPLELASPSTNNKNLIDADKMNKSIYYKTLWNLHLHYPEDSDDVEKWLQILVDEYQPLNKTAGKKLLAIKVKKNSYAACEWVYKYACMGMNWAIFEYAGSLWNNNEKTEALKWFHKAAFNGDSTAMNIFASWRND